MSGSNERADLALRIINHNWTGPHMKKVAILGGVVAALATLAANSALADFVVTDTITNTGTVASPTYLVTPVNSPTANGTISPTTSTISFNLGNSFNGSNVTHTGADFAHADVDPTNKFPSDAWNFQDDYFFSTGGATVQTAVISGTLSGVSFLQARIIYQGGNPSPTLGAPAGGTVIDSWQDYSFSTIGGVVFYNISLPKAIPNGDYVLQIRGEATPGGASASSYGGTIAFTPTPVPLPAVLPLLLSGLGLLGGIGRKRIQVA